jgi:hypothetical protein
MEAVTNIELYEALKKDLNEDAARLIAEVVPAAGDVATKTDIARLEARVTGVEAGLGSRINEVDLGLKGYIDSRLLRYTLACIIPIWISTAGLLATVVAKL